MADDECPNVLFDEFIAKARERYKKLNPMQKKFVTLCQSVAVGGIWGFVVRRVGRVQTITIGGLGFVIMFSIQNDYIDWEKVDRDFGWLVPIANQVTEGYDRTYFQKLSCTVLSKNGMFTLACVSGLIVAFVM